jgi:hypothetical protein
MGSHTGLDFGDHTTRIHIREQIRHHDRFWCRGMTWFVKVLALNPYLVFVFASKVTLSVKHMIGHV